MADVVGLRFITTGEREALAAYERYKKGLLDLDNVQDRHVAAFNRRANEERRIIAQQDAEARRALQTRLRYETEKERATEQAARAVEQAAAREARAIAQQDAEARRAFQRYLTYQQAKERAAEQAANALAQSAAREAQAAQQAAAERDRLATRFNPLYAASKQYERAVEELNAAQRLGVVNSAQYEAALERLNLELSQGASRQNGFAQASMFASRAQNATGMALQQTGYQVGDFLVQIQSGTNAFVAFGQQATQLVGILPMFGSVMGISGTALIGLSAGLGIAIPLVTALAAAFMRTRQSAEDAAGGINSLASQIESANRSTQDFIDRIEIMNRGLASSQELALVRGLEEAEAALASAIAEAQRFSEAVLTGEMAPEFLAAYDEAARAAGELVRLRQEELEAHRRQRAEAERLERAEEARLDSLRRFYELRQQEEDLNAERRAGVQAILQAVEAENRSLQERADILRLTIQYGADSVQVRAREAEIVREAFASEMQRNGILGNNLSVVMQTYDEMARLSGEADASTAAAERLAARMASVADRARAAAQATMGIFQALRATLTELDAREAGIAAAQRTLARGGSEVDARATMAGVSEEARLRGLGAPESEIAAGAAMAAAAERRRLQAEAAERALFAGGAGGGAGSRTEELTTLDAILLRMGEEARQRIQLLGLREDERRLVEAQRQIESELGDARANYSEAAIQQAAAQIAALESLAERTERYRETLRSVENAVGNAFVSFVTGASSAQQALSGLLRNLAQLLANSAWQGLMRHTGGFGGGMIGDIITGLFGGGATLKSANGNVFHGGNVVPFAQGGIVSRPTNFPMADGRTGLMGEAGPEAIIPLKRGRNGRLGVAAEAPPQREIVVTVRAYVDDDAKLRTVVENISGATASRAIDQNNRFAVPALARQAVADARRT